MSEQLDRASLLDQISTTSDEMEALLRKMNDAQVAMTGAEGAWSVRDVIAHLTTWQRLLLNWLSTVSRGEAPLRFAPGYPASEEGMQRLNADFYTANRERTLDDVLTDFRTTHAEVLNTIQALPEEMLNDEEVSRWIEGNTYGHLREHINDLSTWLPEHQIAE